MLDVLPSLHVGGVERGVIELFSAQARSLVASAGGPLEAMLPARSHLRASSLARRDPLSVLLLNPLLLALWCRRHGVIILHAHSRALAVSARVARALCAVGAAVGLAPRVRVVVTWHGYYDSSSAPKRALCRLVLGAADGLIFPSEALAAHVRAAFADLVRRDATVIYRGVALNLALDRASPSVAGAAEHDLTAVRQGEPPAHGEPACVAAPTPTPPPRLRLLLPGRLSRSKGHDLLVCAVRLVQESHAPPPSAGQESHAPPPSAGATIAVVMVGARPSQLARSGLRDATAQHQSPVTGSHRPAGALSCNASARSYRWAAGLVGSDRQGGTSLLSGLWSILGPGLWLRLGSSRGSFERTLRRAIDEVSSPSLAFELRPHGDLREAYRECDVVVVPSRRRGSCSI